MDALGEHSLSILVRDHGRGDLDTKVTQASAWLRASRSWALGKSCAAHRLAELPSERVPFKPRVLVAFALQRALNVAKPRRSAGSGKLEGAFDAGSFGVHVLHGTHRKGVGPANHPRGRTVRLDAEGGVAPAPHERPMWIFPKSSRTANRLHDDAAA
jgi:hypothetical protein